MDSIFNITHLIFCSFLLLLQKKRTKEKESETISFNGFGGNLDGTTVLLRCQAKELLL
ncbi:MAG: hypothetical protein KDC07_10810 [Chitinophagaceae bacterium]|nr:hypothetical protein [Chitinophagaceae bacterium]